MVFFLSTILDGIAMKIGDLVRPRSLPVGVTPLVEGDWIGIVVEVIDHVEVPPVVKVMWHDGFIGKEWTDELDPVY